MKNLAVNLNLNKERNVGEK